MSCSSFATRRAPVRAALFVLIGLAAACGRPDADVQAAIKAQLAKDPVTAPLNVSVEVTRGVAHIVGETATLAEQARVVELARSIEGVKEVTNNMRIADPLIVEAVKKALASDPVLASASIDVDARNGHVRLMSEATDRQQRERAVALARQVDGVKAVEDRMK